MAQDFSQRLPYMTRMIGTTLWHQLGGTLRRFSLTHAQLAALAQLGLEHPAALSNVQMAQRAGVTAQAMSHAIGDLHNRGLITRQPNPHHGRILDVTITDEGMAELDRAQVAVRAVEDRALSALTSAQQRQLKDLLRKVMINLDLYLPDTDDH